MVVEQRDGSKEAIMPLSLFLVVIFYYNMKAFSHLKYYSYRGKNSDEAPTSHQQRLWHQIELPKEWKNNGAEAEGERVQRALQDHQAPFSPGLSATGITLKENYVKSKASWQLSV